MSDEEKKIESAAHLIGCPASMIVDGEIIADETRCVGCGLCRILDDFEGTSGKREALN